MITHFLNSLQRNWKAGFIVAIVSIPFSISIAIASGATPQMGIITAIWAGVIGGLCGGSKFSVNGVTGSLTGVLFLLSFTYGPGYLPLVAILAGFFVLLIGVLNLHRFIMLVPHSALHGFNLGVALTIALGQIGNALGLTLPKRGLFGQLDWIRMHVSETDLLTFLLFSLSVVVIFLLQRLFPKINALILVLPVAMLLGYALNDTSIITLGKQFDLGSTGLWNFDYIRHFPTNQEFYFSAATVAGLVIFNSLVSGKISDALTHTQFNQRREIIAVGLSNIGSGLLGGMPATTSLSRSALNIEMKADSGVASVLNAGFIALIALVLFKYFTYLPMFFIAAALITTSFKMVEYRYLKVTLKYEIPIFVISLLVAIWTAFLNPIVGLLGATVIILLITLYNMSKVNHHFTYYSSKDKKFVLRSEKNVIVPSRADIAIYSIVGQFIYMNVDEHIAVFDSMPKHIKYLVINLSHLKRVDTEGMLAFRKIYDMTRNKNIALYYASISDLPSRKIKKSFWYKELRKHGHICKDTTEVLKHIQI